MSKALRCDRCGGYYHPAETEKKETIFISNIAWRNGESVKENKTTKRMEAIDLCEKCAEDFDLFLNGYPLAIRTDICEENDEGPWTGWHWNDKTFLPHEFLLTAEQRQQLMEEVEQWAAERKKAKAKGSDSKTFRTSREDTQNAKNAGKDNDSDGPQE